MRILRWSDLILTCSFYTFNLYGSPLERKTVLALREHYQGIKIKEYSKMVFREFTIVLVLYLWKMLFRKRRSSAARRRAKRRRQSACAVRPLWMRQNEWKLKKSTVRVTPLQQSLNLRKRSTEMPPRKRKGRFFWFLKMFEHHLKIQDG